MKEVAREKELLGCEVDVTQGAAAAGSLSGIFVLRLLSPRVRFLEVSKGKFCRFLEFPRFAFLREVRLPEIKQSPRVRFFELSEGKFCRIWEL